MRAVLYAVMWVVAAAGSAGCAPASDPGTEAKWAAWVASDFWSSLLNGEEEQAAALLSPELVAALTTGPNADAPWRSLQNTPKGRLYQMVVRDHLGRGMSAKIDTTTVAPDRTEVVVKGRLTGRNEVDDDATLDFTIRVAREAGGGKWGIRYLLITERKQAPGKKP